MMNANSTKEPDCILLIDSDPDVQLALTDYLKAQGYRVRCVGSGTEAIKAMDEEVSYATVLLDLALPDMEGISLLKTLSRLNPHLPVIVITGRIEIDQEIQAFHHGVLAFIRKPYNREQVIALLSRAVEVRNLGLKVVEVERALKESEERFQLTVDNINDGVFYLDLSGMVVWANQQAALLIDRPLHETVGHSFMECLSPEAAALAESRLATIRAGGTVPEVVELKSIRSDGTERWIEANVSNIVRNEKVTGRLLVGRDINERKQSEEALLKSELQFRLVARATFDAIWDWDIVRDLVEWNEGIQSLFGYEPDAVGQDVAWWIENVHPEDRTRVFREVHAVIENGASLWSGEYRFRCYDGNYVIVTDRGYVVHDETGKAIRMVGAMNDITERKQAELDLLERNTLLELDIEVTSVLNQNETIPNLLQGCTEALVRHLDAAFARIWCLDETKQVLQLHASAGLYTHLDGPHSCVPVGQYKIGLIAAEGKPLLTNEVLGDPRVPEQEWAKHEGLVAFAGYPLISNQEVLGVMALFARHPLTDFTLKSLGMVAQRITVAMERQEAKKVTSELMTFNQQLLKSAGEGIYGLDLDGNTTFVNPAAVHMTGYEEDELLGQSQHAVLHHSKSDGSPYPQEECPIYAAFRDGSVHHVDTEVFWRKDKSSFPVQYTSTPIWQDGNLAGAVVTFRDISEQKRAEAIIRKSEQRFRAIYDQAPTGIAILDSISGQFQHINKRYCDIVGYSQEEMLRRSFQDITYPDDLQPDLENMQELLSGEITTFKMEKRYNRKDGKIIWVSLTCVPLWLEDTDPRSHIAIVEDITEGKHSSEGIN
jgi:PAS domain S-box-containing protein